MGIPLLLTWLRTFHGTCFRTLPAVGLKPPRRPQPRDVVPSLCDVFCIDGNALLYLAMEEAAAVAGTRPSSLQDASDFENAVLAAFVAELDGLVFGIAAATEVVYVALDGVAPLGKVAQQRARRANSQSRRRVSQAWDPNAITAGTAFLQRIDDVLAWWCVARAAVCGENAAGGGGGGRAVSFLASGASVPGEGERKIIDFLRAQCAKSAAAVAAAAAGNSDAAAAAAAPTRPTRWCICSNDTDVVVACLAALPVDTDVTVLHSKGLEAPLSLLSIPLLRRRLCARMRGAAPGASDASVGEPAAKASRVEGEGEGAVAAPSLPPQEAGTARRPAPTPTASAGLATPFGNAVESGLAPATPGDAIDPDRMHSALVDVAFVLLLFGGDYLPAVPGMDVGEGQFDALLDLLFSDFVVRDKRLVVDAARGDIDVANVVYFLSVAADEEFAKEAAEARRRDGTAGAMGGGPRKRARVAVSSFRIEGADAQEWGFGAPATSATPASAEAAAAAAAAAESAHCAAYWRGLRWLLRYTAGGPVSWQWRYRRAAAPTARALCTFSAGARAPGGGDDDASAPVDALTQLALVLPEESQSLLPGPFRTALYGAANGVYRAGSGVEPGDPAVFDDVIAACNAAKATLAAADAERARHGACFAAVHASTLRGWQAAAKPAAAAVVAPREGAVASGGTGGAAAVVGFVGLSAATAADSANADSSDGDDCLPGLGDDDAVDPAVVAANAAAEAAAAAAAVAAADSAFGNGEGVGEAIDGDGAEAASAGDTTAASGGRRTREIVSPSWRTTVRAPSSAALTIAPNAAVFSCRDKACRLTFATDVLLVGLGDAVQLWEVPEESPY